jgi:hypothetical protein
VRKARKKTSSPSDPASDAGVARRHPELSEGFTTETVAYDLLAAGDVLGATDMLNGEPEPLGTVSLPQKRKPGRPRGRHFTEKVTFTLEAELLEELDAEVAATHSNRAAVIRAALRDALRERV